MKAKYYLEGADWLNSEILRNLPQTVWGFF